MAALHDCDSTNNAVTTEERTAASCDLTIEEIRPYFSELTCNLRVLGSQLGLEPYELDDLRLHRHGQGDARQRLLEECFKKEKITSWQQFVSVLEKPALAQMAVADRIKLKYGVRPSFNSQVTHSRVQSPTALSDHSSMEIDQTGSEFFNIATYTSTLIYRMKTLTVVIV